MTRVEGWRTTMQRRMLAPMCGLLLAACFKRDATVDSVGIAGVPARSAILLEATTNYTYAAEREPVPVDTALIGAPGGTLPVITVATATQTSATGRVPGNRFSFRLRSDGAYAPMGIAPGLNYVWRDTTSGPEGPYRLLVVPADTTYPMTWLKRDSSVASYVPGPSVEPRLVKSAKGFGACDNTCVPHCVSRSLLRTFTSSDTLRMNYRP
ncbi:MAG: hypothetical protein JWL61_5464 [Gemmatimonadetes bacterium]|nr:hypothetical protein [Gemmatimonadota bacterium]